jgi:hypothetical protein
MSSKDMRKTLERGNMRLALAAGFKNPASFSISMESPTIS